MRKTYSQNGIRPSSKVGFFLSGFNYKIEYIKGPDNIIADSLSRLPSKGSEKESETDTNKSIDVINWVEGYLPVSFLQIKSETNKDGVLQKVMNYLKSSWPKEVTVELKHFYNWREELFIEDNVLFWGCKTVIPQKVTRLLLDELHGSHLGIIEMKSIANSYFWWPSLDQDIEQLASSCKIC